MTKMVPLLLLLPQLVLKAVLLGRAPMSTLQFCNIFCCSCRDGAATATAIEQLDQLLLLLVHLLRCGSCVFCVFADDTVVGVPMFTAIAAAIVQLHNTERYYVFITWKTVISNNIYTRTQL